VVARVITTSKCKEKAKEPILAREPKKTPSPYVPLYPPLPPVPSSTPWPLTSDGEARGTVTPVKSYPEAPWASTSLTSPSPMNPMPTPSPPILTPHLPFNQGHLTSLHKDPSFPQTPTVLQMPLREVQVPLYQGTGKCPVPGQSTTRRRENICLPVLCHHRSPKLEISHPLLHGKTSGSVDLIQCITQTHKPTWTDC
jgi:hypothetical protein